ncbi:hypothetical protein BDM02DRAFT_1402102 [Thelephora ganbajun]|uniref:Uncharacterized protein n=1 Tax=Thelephora ganbajun TaxID=370292 RepID=A0ACB6ZMK9_THEGA|nr:hypothetical protein BDM02DRAFT_1402102 [Thelephora ganbajun]
MCHTPFFITIPLRHLYLLCYLYHFGQCSVLTSASSLLLHLRPVLSLCGLFGLLWIDIRYYSNRNQSRCVSNPREIKYSRRSLSKPSFRLYRETQVSGYWIHALINTVGTVPSVGVATIRPDLRPRNKGRCSHHLCILLLTIPRAESSDIASDKARYSEE